MLLMNIIMAIVSVLTTLIILILKQPTTSYQLLLKTAPKRRPHTQIHNPSLIPSMIKNWVKIKKIKKVKVSNSLIMKNMRKLSITKDRKKITRIKLPIKANYKN